MSAYHWDQLQAHRQQQQQHQFAAAELLPAGSKGGNKRSRQTYSKYQTAVLETVFQTSKYIVRNKRQQMSAELNLTERQIKIWFQNRRMKEKKCSHKDVARADGPAGCPTTAPGYADDYAGVGTAYLDNCQPLRGREDLFADYDGRLPASKHLQDDSGPAAGYAGGGGYDLPELDPYGVAVEAKQQWPPVDFHQDFYDEMHDTAGHLQRTFPNAHNHHRSMNSQVSDYCGGGPAQLQVAHGY